MAYLDYSGLQEVVSKLKSYADNKVDNLDLSLFEVVTSLPSSGESNKIYLIASSDQETQNLYDEYAWVNGAWEKIGGIHLSSDLANYYTKSEVDSSLSAKQDKLTAGTNITISGSTISASQPTLSDLSGIGTISASGSDPLTLSASKSGTTVTITGSVADALVSQAGVVKPYSVLTTDPTVNTISSTSGKYYGVSTNSNNQMIVNVPWTDTTYDVVSSGADGLMSKSDYETLTDLAGNSVTSVSASGTSPLTLSGSISSNKLTISGSISAASTSANGYMSSSDKSTLDSLSSSALTSATASGTDPLTLSASVSNKTLTISGSVANATASSAGVVQAYANLGSVTINTASTTSGKYYGVGVTNGNVLAVNVPWTDTTYSTATSSANGLMSSSDKSTLDTLGSSAVTSVTASGTSPLSLSGSISGTALTISGSVSASSSSSAGTMSSSQYTQLSNLVSDPLQYATAITIAEIDALF